MQLTHQPTRIAPAQNYQSSNTRRLELATSVILIVTLILSLTLVIQFFIGVDTGDLDLLLTLLLASDAIIFSSLLIAVIYIGVKINEEFDLHAKFLWSNKMKAHLRTFGVEDANKRRGLEETNYILGLTIDYLEYNTKRAKLLGLTLDGKLLRVFLGGLGSGVAAGIALIIGGSS